MGRDFEISEGHLSLYQNDPRGAQNQMGNVDALLQGGKLFVCVFGCVSCRLNLLVFSGTKKLDESQRSKTFCVEVFP